MTARASLAPHSKSVITKADLFTALVFDVLVVIVFTKIK
jgi:hypothetical protein